MRIINTMITFNNALDKKGNKDLGPLTISFSHALTFKNLKRGENLE